MSEQDESPKDAERSGNLLGAGLIAGGLLGAALGLATGSYTLYVPLGLAGGFLAGLALHASTRGSPF